VVCLVPAEYHLASRAGLELCRVFRRIFGRGGIDPGNFHRYCSFFWRLYERELSVGWSSQYQSFLIRIRNLACPGLENSGWIGLDRWILPALGTPWRPGRVFHAVGKEAQPNLDDSKQP